uniref:Uncharacterized protein n=1 Tax=Escherichia coli TaxID=562 RepID=Q08JM6_ECOLX|nr:hypothetical protein [Escherichia coli]
MRNVLYFFAAISIGITCNNSAELPVLSYQSLALKHTYEVYFGYDRTLRKYCRFRQKLPVKTDFKKNSARRRPVTGRSPRTGEEAQCICSYREQVRPEALS